MAETKRRRPRLDKPVISAITILSQELITRMCTCGRNDDEYAPSHGSTCEVYKMRDIYLRVQCFLAGWHAWKKERSGQ